MNRLILFLFLPTFCFAQSKTSYRAVMPREDGRAIVFNMTALVEKGKFTWIITNAEERLKVDSIVQKGDSLFAEMPFFDSRFRVKINPDKSLSGIWIKGTSAADAIMQVTATPGVSYRFEPIKGNATYNVSGRYAVAFTKTDGTKRKSVAEFKQVKNKLTGTFRNPSGDYRYLEGIVTGDSLMLSCFDGSHAYFFSAKVNANGTLSSGVYSSGLKYMEYWTAKKDPKAQVEEGGAMMYLKEGEERLNFRFPDLDSNLVAIQDDRYKNKVVVLQIMGSWCPNCMDETAFLSEYYRKNKHRGMEVIGLAYEYWPDFKRSEKTLRKFQQRYNVQYPLLNTGVITNDTLRTEKTLPQFTPIKVFPTTIFIGKDGKVKKVHPGFEGPGTGKHHEEFKQWFNATINELLAQ